MFGHPEGGYEVEDAWSDEDDGKDDGDRYALFDEHEAFWAAQLAAGTVDDEGGLMTNAEWSPDGDRVARLEREITRRGGLPPSVASRLRRCKFAHKAPTWWCNKSDGTNHRGSVDGAGAPAASEAEHVVCGICLEVISGQNDVYELCHPFHVDCIRPWFLRSVECPLCRSDFTQYAVGEPLE